MDIATIYFSDGKSIEVKEGQLFMSIKSINNEKEKLNYASQSNTFELWGHTHDGLIPSILELLFNSEYFFEIDIPSVIYNSKSVTRIENH
ncbi:hypothetical protein [Lysinibacillus sp. RC79]|uniref:hypothetical protein n=1 Tax=Lysinibacillus sp. RC79 TaxID=3156296 RepID=UPI00351531BE